MTETADFNAQTVLVGDKRVVICFMSNDRVHAGFTYDYGNLIGHTVASQFMTVRDSENKAVTIQGNKGERLPIFVRGSGYDMTMQWCLTSIIPKGRMMLVQTCKKMEATHILWIDTDMRFPKESLQMLLAHELDCVGINYVRRRAPFGFTANNLDGYQMVTKPDSAGLEEASHIGMGLLLTKLDLFEGDGPWFAFDWRRHPTTNDWTEVGEDVFMCEQFRNAGHKVWVDHTLSASCKHEGDWDYTVDDMAALDDVIRAEKVPEPNMAAFIASTPQEAPREAAE